MPVRDVLSLFMGYWTLKTTRIPNASLGWQCYDLDCHLKLCVLHSSLPSKGKKETKQNEPDYIKIGQGTILYTSWNTTTVSDKHFDLMCTGRQFKNYDQTLMWHTYRLQNLNYSFVYLIKPGLV